MQLFIPCLMDQFIPRMGAAVVEVLTRLEVRLTYPEEQTCCGQFALTTGNLDTARRLAGHFLRVFGGEGPIVCPSASCTLAVRRDYPKMARTSAERRAVASVSSRLMEFSEFLAGWGILPWTPRYEGILALHRSCKARELGVLPGAEKLLAQVEGLTLTSVSPYYACCGFGGVFKAQHPDLAKVIGEAYLEAVVATGATGLISLEAGCLLHLRGLALGRGWDLKFYHLAEILAGRAVLETKTG